LCDKLFSIFASLSIGEETLIEISVLVKREVRYICMLAIVLLGLSFSSCRKETSHDVLVAFVSDSVDDGSYSFDEDKFVLADLLSEDPFFFGSNNFQKPQGRNQYTKHQTRCAYENYSQLSFLKNKVRAFNCLSMSSLRKDHGYFLYMLCRLLI